MSNRPTFLQAFLLTISGVALAFFGCLGFLSGIRSSSTEALAGIGGIAFAMGVLMAIVGLCLLAFVIIRAAIRAFREPAPPPADSGYPPSTRYGGTDRDSNEPPPPADQ